MFSLHFHWTIQILWENQWLIQYNGEPVYIVINQIYLTCFTYSRFQIVCHVCSESIFRNTVELYMHICHVLTGHIGQNKREQQIVFRQRFGSRPSPTRLQEKTKQTINKYKWVVSFNSWWLMHKVYIWKVKYTSYQKINFSWNLWWDFSKDFWKVNSILKASTINGIYTAFTMCQALL